MSGIKLDEASAERLAAYLAALNQATSLHAFRLADAYLQDSDGNYLAPLRTGETGYYLEVSQS